MKAGLPSILSIFSSMLMLLSVSYATTTTLPSDDVLANTFSSLIPILKTSLFGIPFWLFISVIAGYYGFMGYFNRTKWAFAEEALLVAVILTAAYGLFRV